MAAESSFEQQEADEDVPEEQKIAIAKWFLLNAPPGEIRYVSKDVQSILMNEALFNKVAEEAFPQYNKEQMISIEMSDRSGQVLITQFGEVDAAHYLDPRTAQVATVDHVKQVCTGVRPAADEELPSAYVEDHRVSVDAELLRYVEEAFPRGECAVYPTRGKDAKEGDMFELTVVISAAKFSPQNFCNGRWRSVWKIQVNEAIQAVELKGLIKVVAHYFEEGNVQLDTKYECKDSTMIQTPSETGFAIVNIIRHHESEYLASLEDSYAKLSDTTFKELRRKLPVTRTLFPWSSARQLSLTREITREMSFDK